MKKEKKKADPFYYENLARQFADEELLNTDEMTYGAFHWQGQTYIYDGKRYVLEEELCQRIRAYLIEKNIPQNNNIIGNVAPIVHTLIYKSKEQFPTMPFYMGKEIFPKPENIIAYQNGLLDLSAYLAGKNTLLPHTSLWASTFCMPYDYDPAATCPQWEAFLDDVLGTEGQIELLQEWFGYCLTHDTSQQKFMVWQGLPRAGKGTTWDVLRGVIGEDSACGFTLFQFASPFGLYPLSNKLIGYCGEVELKSNPHKGHILETLKNITGEDLLSVEKKHETPISIIMPTRLIIACNEMPTFYETSGALSDRLLMLKYNKCFAGREDYTLKEKLRSELSGISNWALRGLARLRKSGRFTIPETTQKAVMEFKRDNSPVLAFIQDCLIVENRLNGGNLQGVQLSDGPLSATKAQIEKAYRQWCMDESIGEIRLDWLIRRIKPILPLLQSKINTRGECKVYLGVGIKPTYAI